MKTGKNTQCFPEVVAEHGQIKTAQSNIFFQKIMCICFQRVIYREVDAEALGRMGERRKKETLHSLAHCKDS